MCVATIAKKIIRLLEEPTSQGFRLVLLVFLFLFSPFATPQTLAAPTPETPGSLVALDLTKKVGLINLGRQDGIAKGDTILVFREEQEIARGEVRDAFSDASKVLFSAEAPFVSEGMKIQVIPAPETPARRIKKVFQEKFSGSVTNGFNYYSVGRNRLKSFRERGPHYFEDIDLTYRDLAREKIDIELSTNFQVSDDSYLQPENFGARWLRLAAQEKENRYGLILGDEYTYFSDYSMSQTLKGAKAYNSWLSERGETKLTSVFGTNKHRWEEFYKNLENEPFNRVVTGARLEHRYKGLFTAGFNYVDSRDDSGSDGPAAIAPVTNDLFSIDLRTKFWDRLNIKGEGAFALTDIDAERKAHETNMDKALKIDSDLLVTEFRYFKNQFFYGYERAGENFSALSGILKTDRQEHLLRHRLDIGETLSAKYQFNRYWDNLKDGGTVTTKTIKNEVEAILRPFAWHREAQLMVNLFKIKNESTDKASTFDNDTESLYMQGKTKLRRFTVWSGFKLWRRGDVITRTNSRRTQTVDTGFLSDWNYRAVRITPHFSFEFERDREPTAKTKTTLVRLRMGSNIRCRNSELRFAYLLRDENNRTLTDNADRHMFEVEGRRYLGGDPSRILAFTFRRDDFDHKRVARSYEENLVTVKYIQRI